MFRMKQKVKIASQQKIDGRFNFGTIIGIEYEPDAYYLGYKSEREYVSRFTVPKYKVAYIDCYTNRANMEYFYDSDLEKK